MGEPALEPTMTVAEVAALFRCSSWTVNAMVRDGRLVKIPGLRKTRIPRWSVRQLMEGRYDALDGEPNGEAQAKAPAPRRRHGSQANRPLAQEPVGSGDPVHRRAGPASGDVVIRRVER